MNLALLAERDLRERGERAQLWFEERWFSNGDLHRAGLHLAGALSALGIGLGDRVIVLLANCPEALISLPAIWRVGAVAVPVLHVLPPRELAHVVHNSAAKLIITSLDLLPKLERLTQPLITLVVTAGQGEPSPPALSFERALTYSEPYGDAVARADDDLAVILYTSGISGRPKGVLLSHRNLLANAEHTLDSAARADPDETRPGTQERRDDVNLIALPLAHSFGLEALISSYLSGGRLVLIRRFTASEALRLIERHRATSMIGVPNMFLYMLLEEEPYVTSSMQRWLVRTAAMPVAQRAAFEQRFGGIMYAGYGLAEAGPSIAAERDGEPRKPGAAGRPLNGVRVCIVDDASQPLPPGEPGEICAAGANIALGYCGDPHASATSFRQGWLYTGDFGLLDADGYLFVLERKQDLIIRGSVRMFPKDIEEVVRLHPAVADCAVVWVPDPLGGDHVCACVVVRPGAQITSDELIAHCRAALSEPQTPHYVEFLKTLPRTPLGKVKKGELRAWAIKKARPGV